MTVVKNALIIGGGIGGLTAARALCQQGIKVDLIEKESKWTVYGVGIIQPNNFLRALDKIGLAQSCIERGGPFDVWRVYDAPGNLLLDPEPNNDAAPHLPPNNGITRPILHEILIKGAQEVGANIRLGVKATSLDDDGESVKVEFSDGSNKRYDVVIAYDGVFSDTRKMLFGDKYTPKYLGQGVWRYNLPRPVEVDTAGIVVGSDSKVGLVPMSPTLMYIFLLTKENDDTWYGGPDLADQMRGRMKEYGGLVGRLREQIVDPNAVVYRPFMGVFVENPWRKGRVILAGDAAHTTSAHLAQGAAMAVEDAVLLGDLLGKNGSFEDVVSEFMDRRYDRVKYVVDSSAQIAAWELEKWQGIHNPNARPGELLHEATANLMKDY